MLQTAQRFCSLACLVGCLFAVLACLFASPKCVCLLSAQAPRKKDASDWIQRGEYIGRIINPHSLPMFRQMELEAKPLEHRPVAEHSVAQSHRLPRRRHQRIVPLLHRSVRVLCWHERAAMWCLLGLGDVAGVALDVIWQ